MNERGLKEKLQNFYCWEKVQNQGGQWVFTKYRPQNTQISTKYDKISIAKARIYKMTHFATKVRIFIMAGLLLVESMIWRDRNLKFGPNYDLEEHNLEKNLIFF